MNSPHSESVGNKRCPLGGSRWPRGKPFRTDSAGGDEIVKPATKDGLSWCEWGRTVQIEKASCGSWWCCGERQDHRRTTGVTSAYTGTATRGQVSKRLRVSATRPAKVSQLYLWCSAWQQRFSPLYKTSGSGSGARLGEFHQRVARTVPIGVRCCGGDDGGFGRARGTASGAAAATGAGRRRVGERGSLKDCGLEEGTGMAATAVAKHVRTSPRGVGRVWCNAFV